MIKLLLVDDEKIIRDAIELMLPLEKLNIHLTGSCANAFEALESMEDDMPDILMTDIRMPKLSGLDLIERALVMNPLLQCIILSGYDEFPLAQKAIKMGVREYLLKPCTKVDISNSLTKICNGIRQTRALEKSDLAERDSQIMELVHRIASLRPDESTHKITAYQIHSLVNGQGAESLLRETYTYLITHRIVESERGFAAIQTAYEEGADCAALIAEEINSMQLHTTKYRYFVSRMCSYIQKHYSDESLSLQYLADHVIFMRADYIGREFAKDTGMKLSAYLLQVRMEKAKVILSKSVDEQHVYEVAEAVGLGHNPQYFSQLFRRYTGVSPKEYKKQNEDNHRI